MAKIHYERARAPAMAARYPDGDPGIVVVEITPERMSSCEQAEDDSGRRR